MSALPGASSPLPVSSSFLPSSWLPHQQERLQLLQVVEEERLLLLPWVSFSSPHSVTDWQITVNQC